jgi:hypothetical protein
MHGVPAGSQAAMRCPCLNVRCLCLIAGAARAEGEGEREARWRTKLQQRAGQAAGVQGASFLQCFRGADNRRTYKARRPRQVVRARPRRAEAARSAQEPAVGGRRATLARDRLRTNLHVQAWCSFSARLRWSGVCCAPAACRPRDPVALGVRACFVHAAPTPGRGALRPGGRGRMWPLWGRTTRAWPPGATAGTCASGTGTQVGRQACMVFLLCIALVLLSKSSIVCANTYIPSSHEQL